MEKILQQNSTHKAVAQNGKIAIYTKGLIIPVGYKYPNGDVETEEFVIKPELLYVISLDRKDDLLAIFERFDEDNRCNVAEFINAF